jgi:drug/metabolite transporter (DMT)-like permease
MIPVWVMAGSAFLGDRPGPRAIVGMALAVGGATVLGFLAPAAERRATLVGDGLTLLGMTSFSCYILLSRRVLTRDGAFATVTRAFVASVPFAVPMLAFGAMRTNWAAVTWKGWSGLAFMIVGATFLCYSLHMWSLARLDALKVAVFTDAQPVLTAVIAQAFGVERLTSTLAIAAAVVIAGVVLVQTSRRAPAEPRAAAGSASP